MLQLKPKQQLAVEAANDPTVDTLVLFGTVGTGKTDVAAHIVISICHKFPNTRWPVFRANTSTAIETIIPSYLDMLDKMNFVQDEDYVYREKPYFIRFNNGSTIRFRDADPSKDRGGKKIKGINASGNHIDEADELLHEMYVQATSRKGRHNENGQPSLSILTFNPTDAEHLIDIYNKFRFPEEYGELPKGIKCIEFGLEDSWQTEEDIEQLKTNPEWYVQRYLYNNWKFADESKTLFKSKLFAQARTDTYEPKRKTSGYDVAREKGGDQAVNADWDNFTLLDIQVVKDNDSFMETDDQAQWLIEHSDTNGIGYENIAVDGVGLGVGVLDTAKMKFKELGVDTRFDVYKSGYPVDMYLTYEDTPKSRQEAEKDAEILSFANLRSQVAYMFSRGMERGTIKILDSCPYFKELIREAQMHHFDIKDKVLILESKISIKARTGKSPDIFDAVIMGLWKQLKKQHVLDYSWAVK